MSKENSFAPRKEMKNEIKIHFIKFRENIIKMKQVRYIRTVLFSYVD